MRVTVWNKKKSLLFLRLGEPCIFINLNWKVSFFRLRDEKIEIRHFIVPLFHFEEKLSQFIVTCYFVSALFHFRYICVCVPLKHNELSNRRLIICMVFMYFASVVANWDTPLVGKFSQHSATWNVTQENSKWFVILQQKT